MLQVLQEGEGTGRRGHRVLRVEPQKASELQWWWACEDVMRLPCHVRDLGLHSGLAAASVCRGPCGWCVCVWCSDTGLPLIAPDCHASWQSVVQRHGSAVDARLDYGLTGPGPHSPFTHPVWEAPGQDLLGLLGLSAVAVERGSCVSCAACGVCRAVCGVGRRAVQPQLRGGEG